MSDVRSENQILRRLLWLRHGHEIAALYGDDGEMQCALCPMDFKRDPAEWMEFKFELAGKAALERSKGT